MAETVRRAVGMYLLIAYHEEFYKFIARLNGRRLIDVIVELLVWWADGKIVLASDPQETKVNDGIPARSIH